jgi:hypothetical protein
MEPKLARRRREARLRGLVQRQHGAIARRQLVALGLSAEEIRIRRSRGDLLAVHRGVMVLAGVRRTRATAECAAWLAFGDDAVVSGHTAAYRRGLLPYPAGGAEIDITVRRAGAASREGIRVHRTQRVSPHERELLDGIPTTSVDRTLLDLAARGTARELERALAVALDTRATSRPRLRRYLAARRRWPGASRLRSLLNPDNPPRLTRSPPEERLLALVRATDLPDPLTNHRVGPYDWICTGQMPCSPWSTTAARITSARPPSNTIGFATPGSRPSTGSWSFA